jgi:putative spermidine/putrescine transport system ATP-binding protein
MRRTAKTDRRRRAEELLELVGLAGRGQRFPFELSGGQQQRVAIARALAIEPTVLLLDEPLSALDARVRTQLREEIRGIQRRLGITTLFVTHDQSEALSMADRVGVMNSGRLEQLDTPETIYRQPASAFVAEFVGSMNRVPGRLGEGDEVVILGQRVPARSADGIPVAPGGVVDVMLRPESLEAIPDVAGPGEITERTFLGSALRLRVALDGGEQVVVETNSTSDRLAVGSRVGLRVLADSVAVSAPVHAPVAVPAVA